MTDTHRVPEEGRSPASKGGDDVVAELAEDLAEEVSAIPEVSNPVPEEGALAPVSKGPFGDLEGVSGVGIDVVGITAFAQQLEQPGTRFAQAFTPGERRGDVGGLVVGE